jgi:hypothetical protein
MAYRPYFTIELNEDSLGIIEAVIDAIEEETGYLVVYQNELCCTVYDVSWHNWDTELKEISLAFADTLFTITREGDDSNDKWIAYIRNGNMQWGHVVLFYPPLDEAKLLANAPADDVVPIPKPIYDRLVDNMWEALNLLGAYYPTDDDVALRGSSLEDQKHHEEVSNELDRLLLILKRKLNINP